MTLLHAALLCLHALAAAFWVGGMAVITLAVRPAAVQTLEPPLRLAFLAADDDLADPAHGLAVGREHADRAQVVQHVFCGDGLTADAAFGKRQVLGDAGVEVVADHHR